MEPMKQIVCMKWGTLYSSDYVNRLYSMISRNITPPFRLICLTDDPVGIDPRVEILPCPTIAAPAPFVNTGWRKLVVWAPRLGGLTGELLFLDLDVVIVGNIDEFFTYGQGYMVMRNFTTPKRRIGNTSVFRFPIGEHPYVLDRFLAGPLDSLLQGALYSSAALARFPAAAPAARCQDHRVYR